MKTTICKVFPISITQTRQCCICYEFKKDYKTCANVKCSDGIICYKCLEKMDTNQKKICPICRTKMDTFKSKIKPEPIDIYIDTDYNHEELYKKEKKIYCIQHFFKFICTVALLLIGAYAIGLVTICTIFNLNIKLELQIGNPLMYIFVGMFIIIGIMFCCVRISYLANKNNKS